jgi:threonine synthase
VTYVRALACRECGREVEVAAVHVCELCFGPLEVVYDYEAIRDAISREQITAGPATLWRYAPLLPVLDDAAEPIDLGAGYTPLVAAPRLAAALGLRELWLKNDTVNPTGSFKDRVVSVALTAARALGFDTAACASTGNLAHAVAAHAAVAGFNAYVFVPADLEPAKLVAGAVYGADLVAVEGSYDAVNRLCAEVAGDRGWAFVNVNVRPFYAEGSKTLGFEIAEQLGWRFPDHVVAPMASGAMLVKIEKAFRELVDVGLATPSAWRVSGAQAAGCAPIANAFAEGSDTIRPVRPDTVAKSLAIGDPADGVYALEVDRRTGGGMAAVTDAEITDAIGLLARTEGIFAETAGGVTVAALRRLVADGVVDPSERVVAVISGVGLKTVDAVAPEAGPAAVIPASLDAFEAAFALEEAS